MARRQSERLRGNFADVLRRQAIEALDLAREARLDPDLGEALEQCLGRISETASSLHLEAIERAATAAAGAVHGGEGGVESIEMLLEQCRALDGVAPVLRPVLVVAANGENQNRLRTQAEGLALSVHVVDDAKEALRRARLDSPAALVLPAADLEAAMRAGIELRGLPIYVYGEDDDLAKRLHAAQQGAAGYLPTPLDLRDAVPRIRHRLSAEVPGAYHLLLVDSNRAAAAAFGMMLQADDVVVTTITNAARVLDAIEKSVPDLVILALGLEGMSAVDLVTVLRGHHRYGDVPRVLLADDATSELRGLFTEAEAVLRRDADMFLTRTRVRGLLERSRRERLLRAVDLSTGVLTRAALLRAADREIAAARRSRVPLAVVRMDVLDGVQMRARHGAGVLESALRQLARAMREELRETDLVGHLGVNGFVGLLPSCLAENALSRTRVVEARYTALTAADPVLSRIPVCTGIADTTQGIEDVLLRADRDLLQARGR